MNCTSLNFPYIFLYVSMNACVTILNELLNYLIFTWNCMHSFSKFQEKKFFYLFFILCCTCIIVHVHVFNFINFSLKKKNNQLIHVHTCPCLYVVGACNRVVWSLETDTTNWPPPVSHPKSSTSSKWPLPVTTGRHWLLTLTARRKNTD